jgi:hypothetical protein
MRKKESISLKMSLKGIPSLHCGMTKGRYIKNKPPIRDWWRARESEEAQAFRSFASSSVTSVTLMSEGGSEKRTAPYFDVNCISFIWASMSVWDKPVTNNATSLLNAFITYSLPPSVSLRTGKV